MLFLSFCVLRDAPENNTLGHTVFREAIKYFSGCNVQSAIIVMSRTAYINRSPVPDVKVESSTQFLFLFDKISFLPDEHFFKVTIKFRHYIGYLLPVCSKS
jgi:hypothetical protein